MPFQVGSNVRAHPEALRMRAVRVDRGEGVITKIYPGRSYGVWPAFLLVRWSNGQTTDIHVKNVYEIEPVCDVDISRCDGLKSLLVPNGERNSG